MVSRDVFDNLLLEKAKETGAEVHTGEKVYRCAESPGYVEVTTEKETYQARFAIIAEGAHGLLKTCVRPVDNEEECGVCVVTEIPAEEEEIKEKIGKTVDMYFGVAGGGYGWIFPHGTYYSVGIGGLIKDLPHPKETMLEFLKCNGFSGNYKLKGHKILWAGLSERLRAQEFF
ncbi:geranylgeranyl reductase family protein [Methanosarcina horonobensis]|uniref:hypothetical protein n=1 Tax=Methanosarcina horonobensis TaxID=418008 RepID=UPI000ABC2A9B